MIDVAILGVAHGHIYHLVACAQKIPGARLIGVFDEDPARLEGATKKLGIPGFNKVEDLLALKPKLTLIASVPCDRSTLAEKSLAAGAAAMVDKPLALTHAALDRIMAAQAKYGLPVGVFYPYRGLPAPVAAKAAVTAGKIGQVVRVFSTGPHRLSAAGRPAWHFTRGGNGGAMIDIGSHHMDFCCWIADAAPTWISSVQTNVSQPGHPEFQDFAMAQLRFASGALGAVEVDWLTPDSMKSFGDTRQWIQGTKGRIEIRFGDEPTTKIWTPEGVGPLDVSGLVDGDTWAANWMADMVAGKGMAVSQADIWRASRATLYAFDSALAGGKPIEPLRW